MENTLTKNMLSKGKMRIYMNEYLSTSPPLGNDDSTQKYAYDEKHNLGESEKRIFQQDFLEIV